MNNQKDIKIDLFIKTIQEFIALDWKNIKQKSRKYHSELYLKYESKLLSIIRSYEAKDFFPAKDFILAIAQYESQLYHLPLSGIIHFHHPFILCRVLIKEIHYTELKLNHNNDINLECLCDARAGKTVGPNKNFLFLIKEDRNDFYDQFDEYQCKSCGAIWHYSDRSTEQYTQWAWECKTKLK